MEPSENHPPAGRSPADTEQIISVIVYVLVGVVALFTFVVSYSHIYDLGRANGQHGIAAKGTPLSVDLLIVAASLIMWLQARTGVRPDGLARWLPRLMLYSGIVATVLANVAYGWSYGRLGAVLSAWPGYVFAGLAETVMVTARWQREQSREPVKQTLIPAGQPDVPSTSYEAAAAAYAASVAGGNPLTEYQLHKRFGIARSVTRKIVTPAAPELAPASMNGDGSHE
jgi:hypothetical protein